MFPFFLLALAYFPSASAFLSAYVFCMKAPRMLKEDQNGEQVEKHLPLWWGPWSGSRSARACVGCTVMSWQWSAETAAQPRPPRARHRTSARRPSASQKHRGEKQNAINMCSTQQIIAPKHHGSVHNQRNINIISWLNQSLTSKLRCIDLHLFMLWTQWPWIIWWLLHWHIMHW